MYDTFFIYVFFIVFSLPTPYKIRNENVLNCCGQRGAKVCNVNLIELVKSFPTSVYYLTAKVGFDTAEKEPSKVCRELDG